MQMYDLQLPQWLFANYISRGHSYTNVNSWLLIIGCKYDIWSIMSRFDIFLYFEMITLRVGHIWMNVDDRRHDISPRPSIDRYVSSNEKYVPFLTHAYAFRSARALAPVQTSSRETTLKFHFYQAWPDFFTRYNFLQGRQSRIDSKRTFSCNCNWQLANTT